MEQTLDRGRWRSAPLDLTRDYGNDCLAAGARPTVALDDGAESTAASANDRRESGQCALAGDC